MTEHLIIIGSAVTAGAFLNQGLMTQSPLQASVGVLLALVAWAWITK